MHLHKWGLGVGIGQEFKGCSPGIMQTWSDIEHLPDRQAGIGKNGKKK